MSKLKKEDFSKRNADYLKKAFIEGIKFCKKHNPSIEKYFSSSVYYIKKQKKLKEILFEIPEISDCYYNLETTKYCVKFNNGMDSIEFVSDREVIEYLFENFPMRMEFDKSFK